MFSIYAIGVKKGYRRETRVKVQSVVDFRNAPQLGATGATGAGTPGTGTGAATGTGTTTQPSAAQQSQDAITAAMQPSTGGQVVYFRVE
jgi:hypothetical protein